MKLTKEHILELFKKLSTETICDYVIPGNFTVKRKSIENDNDVHFALFENGIETQKDVPLTNSAMETMANSIIENTPISIDAALVNGGNKRSAIEGALIRTSEFYSIKIGRNKNIVWVPSKPHPVGVKGMWPENEELPAAPNDDIPQVAINQEEPRDDYSLEELGKYLSAMAKAENGKNIMVVCAAFGLKFGKAINKNNYKANELIDAANKFGANIDHAQDGTVNIGKSLHDVVSKQKFGLYFSEKANWKQIKESSFNVFSPFITALRTKPFLLLAGISGTGKSQKVQELAYMTCPEGELRNENGTAPGNYCLVEVKPNWHDSTELLGYYSALSGRYELTDFIRFVYKAIKNETVPFFLCLDEMNLAPVEQYFAEYLSVLETRKNVDGRILTQPLLKKEMFANCALYKKEAEESSPHMTGDGTYQVSKALYTEKDAEIISYLKDNGLSLPENLFVIGTVNMDDTTHQFSRKVIDRAFTIEMNGGNMADMFSDESKALLEYRNEEDVVPLAAFRPKYVRAYEVLDDEQYAKYADTIKTKIPVLLGNSDGTADEDSINGVLNNTPFRVSYRVQNELVLYLSVLIEQAGYPEEIDSLIGEAVLAILLEKVLPRVQGEQRQLATKNGSSNVLKDLKAFVAKHFAPAEGEKNALYQKVVSKLDEMDEKLDNYYTNFF